MEKRKKLLPLHSQSGERGRRNGRDAREGERKKQEVPEGRPDGYGGGRSVSGGI
ncbi:MULTISPECIES: hypothetical protein [Olivibacter]|uniref:Uncharacterized protein n=1 Tax=Olivibacter oleidegradans TaxID=760123 RepID=A0ABV6HQV9_9SPHI|nr:hypothetical protein [Olivibacter sp. LS-1]